MSLLILCPDGSIVVGESVTKSIADDFADNIESRTTPPVIENVRTEMINRVRRQLARGSYDLDERLDAVLERILMDVTT
jgi:hypothetical protein